LLGTWPDYVILCVNLFDSIDYVKRTIRFIETSVNCVVGACAIIPTIKGNVDFNNDGWEERYTMIKEQYERIKIKLYRIDVDSEVEQMGMDMLNFFAKNKRITDSEKITEGY
jgi:hypothetical protein